MKTYEFGKWPSKRIVTLDDKTIKIESGKKVLSDTMINAIKVVYLTSPTESFKGNVQFSTGDPKTKIGTNPETDRKSFMFTQNEQSQIDELLKPFEGVIQKTKGEGLKTFKEQMNEADKVAKSKKDAKTQAKMQTKRNQSKITCPNCRSLKLVHMGNNKKAFSVGKAIGGAALTGGIGTIAGFAGKKGKTNKWRCQECGNVFDK